MTRTEYISIAKVIRNAELPVRQRNQLVKKLIEVISNTTVCMDKKQFTAIATMELD